jgi:NADH-quinone oxidoreductase subunit L
MMFAWMLVATSAFTVFYTARMLWFVFLSEPRKTSLLTIQEVPTIMRIPLILLSVGSLWWMISLHPLEFSGWLLESVQVTQTHNILITWLSVILVSAATLLALLWYKRRKEPRTITILQEGYYLDNMNAALVTKPVMFAGNVSERLDKRWIDGFIHGVVYITVGGAHLLAWFDRYIIDGLVDMTGRMAMLVGSIARSFSGGKIQSYIFWSVFAVIIFLFWVLFS